MISGLGAAQAGFRLLGCLSRGSGICDDSRSWRLPGWTEPSGLTWLQPDSLGSSIFNDFFGLGVSRAGFRFLGCLSRGSGQTCSDFEFSMISGLGGSPAGFRLLGCLSRGSGQTRSSPSFSMISGFAPPGLDSGFWDAPRKAPARLAQIINF